MAADVEFGELKTRVRFRGGFENSRAITDTRLAELLNQELRHVWDLLIRHRSDPQVSMTTTATVVNDPLVVLPSNFYRLRQLEILDGTEYFPLAPVNLSEAWRFERGTTQPRGFRYRVVLDSGNDRVRLAPTPTRVYTLRVWYYPTFADLVDDTDVFNGVNGYEDLVIARVIEALKLRDGMPANEWSQLVARREAEIKAEAEVDGKEPFLLSGGVDDFDEDVWWVP